MPDRVERRPVARRGDGLRPRDLEVPRDQVEEVTVSPVSLMPEGVEKQLKPQEIADLFAFLCLDKPPSDPSAKRIPGSPNPKK